MVVEVGIFDSHENPNPLKSFYCTVLPVNYLLVVDRLNVLVVVRGRPKSLDASHHERALHQCK